MVSREELEVLRKRLEKAESAIEKLEKTDLLIAKLVANALSLGLYRTALLWIKGEELNAAIAIWDKRLEAIREELKAAQTVKSVFEIQRKFDRELAKYIRAEKVETAEEAMDIAHTFIKKYSTVALPMKAVKEGDVWLVDIDVGALAVKIAKIKIDAKTGDILNYEIPEKSTKEK